MGCWNIRKGLITREIELKKILKDEKIDVMFLTETDTKAIFAPSDYQIEGFFTVLPLSRDPNKYTRMIGLVKNDLKDTAKILTAIMNEEFPSIWLEITEPNGSKLCLGGFYREWSQDGKKSES